MMALIEAGTPVGIVARAEGKTVGWCSVAPRETYRKLSQKQDDSEAGVWSIVCFYVPRASRGRGLASALLVAAIDHAFAKGARTIEAYPVDRPGIAKLPFHGLSRHVRGPRIPRDRHGWLAPACDAARTLTLLATAALLLSMESTR
ncbi:GNAT family N-acetyltransferase [Mesorhizobium sp.]|uniref:GNAT family N-acetyltransferase n=1 Tax=Mesorhizobium sp. TaxID=1871066 RepID=UPI0025BEA47E|nr:GNAT family N-acetyltransferase [Mesorhizobium sp.]